MRPYSLSLLFTLAFASGVCNARADCSTKDMEIKQLDWRRGNKDFVRIVGEVVNRCAQPAGLEIGAVFRDNASKVVRVENFWPAGTRNIQPGASYPFEITIQVDLSAVKMESAILNTRTW